MVLGFSDGLWTRAQRYLYHLASEHAPQEHIPGAAENTAPTATTRRRTTPASSLTLPQPTSTTGLWALTVDPRTRPTPDPETVR